MDMRQLEMNIAGDHKICCLKCATDDELRSIANDEMEAKRVFERLRARLTAFMDAHVGVKINLE